MKICKEPMHFYFQYLSTRSGKAVLLFFDRKRYVFNCFEGFQRYSIEKNIKLSSLNAIFLCSVDAIPPLVGTYLTIGDTGKSEICIVGLPSYEQILRHAKAFANRKTLKRRFVEQYSDDVISVETLDVCGECTYVVKLPTVRGRLHVEKLPVELPKKLYSQLCSRQKVVFGDTSYDGNDFLGNDICPGRVAVVYSTRNYETVKTKLESLSIEVFIVFDKECAEYLRARLDGTFYLLEDSRFVEFRSFYMAQIKVNQADENYIVPAPGLGGRGRCLTEEPEHGADVLRSGDSLNFCKESRRYCLQRSAQTPYVEVPQLHTKTPALFFLGTGCAMPSKYRNVSSTLVQTETLSYLLDCGEDTLYQIHRAFGSFDIIKTLSFVFISHSHADHHLGLVSVLKQCLIHGVRIRVFAPAGIRKFVNAFFGDTSFDFYETNKAVALKEGFHHPNTASGSLWDCILRFDFGFKLSVCGVSHNADGCGALVETSCLSVAYSGDTMPDALFQALASGCDVLIHEATFEESLDDRAKVTKHSTVGEALEVWEHTGAKRLVLTHLSQRHKLHLLFSANVTLAYDLLRYLPGEKEDLAKKRAVSSILQTAFSIEDETA